VAELPVVRVVQPPANADLDGSRRIDEPFLDRSAKRSAMVKLRSEIIVAGVAMRIEVDKT